MAAAVLGGLAVSTILSLVVVPAVYVVSDRVRSKVFKAKPPAPSGSHGTGDSHGTAAIGAPLSHTQPMAVVAVGEPEPPRMPS